MKDSFRCVALVVVMGLAQVMQPALAQQSMTCQFNLGPRVGSRIDFTGVQGATPGVLGSACQDGLGSSGILVSQDGSVSSSATPVPAKPMTATGVSATCQFAAGPRAGQTINFEGVPGARPGPIGLPCQDGIASSGVIVAPTTPGAQRLSGIGQEMPALSYLCQFTTGPLAGQRRNYQGIPGVQPGPVGAPCNDGISSVGVIVP